MTAEDCSIPPDSSKLVGTGIAVSLPSMSCYMQLQSPPLSPCYSDINVQAGVIDADYRGEVKVLINNRSSGNTLRICTGVFVELNTFKEQNLIADIMSIKKGIDVMSWEINSDTEEIVLVEELDVKGRGCRGFGSTGMK
nr:uncharacterized protein LOC113816929 [Penaeus vannamei]